MSVGGIFLFIALLVGAIGIIGLPWLRKPEEAPLSDSPLVDELNHQHTAIVRALRDLEFDYQTQKLSANDYRDQRETLISDGARLLQQIDLAKADLVEQAIRSRRRPSA
jgi:hypothetical protein